jgi:hypothetical protein
LVLQNSNVTPRHRSENKVVYLDLGDSLSRFAICQNYDHDYNENYYQS